MRTVTCSTCTASSDVPLEEGRQPDMPVGWSQLTIAERGRVINNFQRCTDAVRQEMHRLNARYRDSLRTTP